MFFRYAVWEHVHCLVTRKYDMATTTTKLVYSGLVKQAQFKHKEHLSWYIFTVEKSRRTRGSLLLFFNSEFLMTSPHLPWDCGIEKHPSLQNPYGCRSIRVFHPYAFITPCSTGVLFFAYYIVQKYAYSDAAYVYLPALFSFV